VNDEKYDQGSKVAVCILAPSCFALGANVIADFEGDLIGIQPGNVNQDTSNFNYNIMIGMLWADVVIYGVLAWYLDKVFPSEFGTALPFYFPILPSYWCGVRLTHNKHDKSASHSPFFLNLAGLFENSGYRRVTPRKNQNEAGEIVPSGEKSDVELTDPKHHMSSFEEVPPDLKQQIQEEKCITIRGLRKVFKSQSGGDDKVAVKNLDMEMFQNQCTVLLGHNGAGKTTTISMLVGMINPSDGYALMPGGLDINTDMAAIRRNLGVCPQHDILFPDLTALQHLEVTKSIHSSFIDISLIVFLDCFCRSLLLSKEYPLGTYVKKR
jgi:ABC-type multidrug transport system fused ATPase/permease subunit